MNCSPIFQASVGADEASAGGGSPAHHESARTQKRHYATGDRVNDFPSGFIWGAATAAYQIEGACIQDGKGPSIWDEFAHTPGRISDGNTGDIACDSYRRYAEDIELMRVLNLQSYRFSIAWPRIQPYGKGRANQRGLDYYRRLIDALLEAGIRPMPTLYHWDLPLALEESGGWPNRDTADRFVDYAQIVANAMGDRVNHWTMFNEPRAFTHVGYWQGRHAPGLTEPLPFLKATHVVNLAQGKAFHALKAINSKFELSGAYDVSIMVPATDREEDIAAAERLHRFQNLWFIDPALTGEYPTGVLPEDQQAELLGFKDGDDKLLRADLDFIGLNYYSRTNVHDLPAGNGVPGLNTLGEWGVGPHAKSDFGWDIDPDGFYRILKIMSQHLGNKPIEILENGIACNIDLDVNGQVKDSPRIDYLQSHLRALVRAINEGVPIRSYHCWSLLDNFEWAKGYSMRFGLVHVDYDNGQKRSIKDSGYWYAKVVEQNRVLER